VELLLFWNIRWTQNHSGLVTRPRVREKFVAHPTLWNWVRTRVAAMLYFSPTALMAAPYNSSMSSSPNSSRGGKSPASHLSGLTNTPQLVPHSKYFFPLMEPSFLPVGSSSVTPIQLPMPPGISGTGPMYDIVPRRWSLSGSRRTRPFSVRPACLVSWVS
jgi:hypothetical protein